MKIFYHDQFVLPLPENHRFPMEKYALLRQRVVAARLVPPGNLAIPEAAGDADLLRAHTAGYVERVKSGSLSPQEIRRMGFPWSPALVERSRRSVGSTLAAGPAALQDGVAVNLAGGTHHAGRTGARVTASSTTPPSPHGPGRPPGWCGESSSDRDVHQGNGTAAICRGDETIFYFLHPRRPQLPFHERARRPGHRAGRRHGRRRIPAGARRGRRQGAGAGPRRHRHLTWRRSARGDRPAGWL